MGWLHTGVTVPSLHFQDTDLKIRAWMDLLNPWVTQLETVFLLAVTAARRVRTCSVHESVCRVTTDDGGTVWTLFLSLLRYFTSFPWKLWKKEWVDVLRCIKSTCPHRNTNQFVLRGSHSLSLRLRWLIRLSRLWSWIGSYPRLALTLS